jgi:aminoglycoside phosphotransferase (APT) family kinase protein
MPTPWQRDLEKDAAALVTWLGDKLPNASGLRVSDLREPQSSGFSNDTLLFELEYEEAGPQREELVVRIQPTGFQVFPEYDLSVQFRSMQLLAPTTVPVPRVRWLEEERTDLLGAAFYVMDRVDGRVPTDNPPYHADGWLKNEATPEQRAQIWWGGIDSLAAIHQLDYRKLGFDFLDEPELGDDGLQQGLAYYAKYFEWAARGRELPTAQAAYEWLTKNAPSGEADTLLWGDARIGNIIFQARGTQPVAVIDWEMVTHGSPEQDLAWAIFLDRHHSEGIETPRLEGFPSYEESIARYEELSGHAVQHLHYYQVYAGFRFAVIMTRLAQQMVHYEVMDEATGRNFELNNTVTRLLAKLLELPPPGEGTSGSFDG